MECKTFPFYPRFQKKEPLHTKKEIKNKKIIKNRKKKKEKFVEIQKKMGFP